jgi:hypothetical protein
MPAEGVATKGILIRVNLPQELPTVGERETFREEDMGKAPEEVRCVLRV